MFAAAHESGFVKVFGRRPGTYQTNARLAGRRPKTSEETGWGTVSPPLPGRATGEVQVGGLDLRSDEHRASQAAWASGVSLALKPRFAS